jgi:TRAP-type C4-dicarboxylate transport system, small permease component
MLKAYSKFLDKLETIEKLFLYVTVTLMVIVIVYQVILRYCFSASNSWSEELARYLFIYDVMIGAAIATRKNSHLQVDFLINLLKPKMKALFTVVATSIGMVFLVFLFSYSLTLVQTASANISAGLGIPMSIPYACMPIGIVLMMLTSLEVVFKNVEIMMKGEEGVSEQ